GTTIGMAIGAEIAPAHPAPIGTVRIGAEVRRGVDLTSSSPRRYKTRGRRRGGVRARVRGVLTGVTVRLGGEACKGVRLAAALWWWGCGLQWRRARGSGVTWPHPLEHDAQPHQGDQHQLVEKELGDHGKTPSYRRRNEGILPGLAGCQITRTLEVHD